MRAALILVVALAGCSGSPTGPSRPSAPPTAFTGTVVDTVTGSPIAGYTAVLSGGRVTISAPGYLTRETSAAAVVDLIPDAAPFDLGFFRQFARNGLDAPGQLRALSVHAVPPRVVIHTHDTSGAPIDPRLVGAAETAILQGAAGFGVPLAGVERSDSTQTTTAGRITVSWLADVLPGICGRSTTGSGAQIQLNYRAGGTCACGTLAIRPNTVKHELGHALGFFHTDGATDIMRNAAPGCDGQPSERERFHAQIAYKRKPGNLDVDRDQ